MLIFESAIRVQETHHSFYLEKDPFEQMWDDETEEAENDVMSLTISFMTVNAWRFAILGFHVWPPLMWCDLDMVLS